MSETPKQPEKTITVLIEDGATAGYLLKALRETFNGTARVQALNTAQLLKRDSDKKSQLDKTDVLFIPGVRRASQAYREKIGDKGGKAIKNWVKNGGTIVGLCQGGYLLTKEFRYKDKYSGETRVIRPSTGIFQGVAFGPVHEYTSWDERENPFADHRVAKLAFNDAAAGAACYAHGPWLEISAKAKAHEYNIIARYDDIKDKPVAIATRHYGKGKAIFSGVVPEISGLDIPGMDDRLAAGASIEAAHAQTGADFARKLAAHEPGRRVVWNRLISEIGLS